MLHWNETALFSQFVAAAFKSTLIFGTAWILAGALRRSGAAARHLVWIGAAVMALILPILSLALPELHIPVRALPAVVFTTSATASQANTAAPAQLSVAPAQTNTVFAWPSNWRIALMLLWAAGAGVALIRMLAGYFSIFRIRRSAARFQWTSLDSGLCGTLCRALGIRGQVNVLESPSCSMPMAAGVLRCAVFMPSEAATWSEERKRIVLLHELAHISRGDLWSQWLAHAALIAYWWNPLAWKAWREILRERERATDDIVLNSGAKASDYASHLLAVATAMRGSFGLTWAAVPVARRSDLEGRLSAILDSTMNRRAPGRAFVAASILAAAFAVVPLAAVRAQEPPTVPADVDNAVRIATSQKNYEILEDAAKAAEKQGKYDTAKQLLEPALTIREAKAGSQSTDYAVGLLKLGDLENVRGNQSSAEDFYSRAAQILGNKPEAAPALLALGKAALKTNNYEKAIGYFDRAQIADSSQASIVAMWQAIAQQKQGKAGEAEALYKTALLRQGPNSTASVATMLVYAKFLRLQNREEEAKDLETRAAAIQKETALTPKLADSVFRVSDGVTGLKVLNKTDPQYSEEARLAMLAGTVTISIVVGTDGLAHDMQVVRSLGLGLDQKALEAIGQWTFQPGVKDGQPVSVAATVEVNFRLL